jgi:hypothetical protein
MMPGDSTQPLTGPVRRGLERHVYISTLIAMDIDRNWLFTIATYGSWLPGDERGFVSHFRPTSDERVIHTTLGTPRAADMPHLRKYCRNIMTGEPVILNLDQSFALLAQFHETTAFRHWKLWATSIMGNHFHAVIGVPGDPDPFRISGD